MNFYLIITMSDPDDDEESGIRRKPIKPEYAFGTPLRQKIVHSDFAHLGPDMVGFATELAAHTDGGDLAKRPSTRDSPKKRKPRKRDKKPPPGIRPSLRAADRDAPEIPGGEQPGGKEPLEPCERPECKDVLQKIQDIQFKNEMEREDILRICEDAVYKTEMAEEESKELEETVKAIHQDGLTLEESLEQLEEKLQKYEKRLAVQIQAKDELNNKVREDNKVSSICA